MPYKNIKELPASIKKLPIKAQTMFMKAFNSSIKRVDEETALKAAWSVIKQKFKRVNGKWIARGMGQEVYSFTLENKSDMFIQRSDDGEYYLEAVLSNTQADKYGTKFSEEALKDFAEQINSNGLSGFITHKDWNEFCMTNGHLDEREFVARARNERKGILKTVRAIYEKGKLWIKALIDKRYIKHAQKFDKVSIESLVPKRFQKDNTFTGGHVLGVALLSNPGNTGATARIIKA